jgi:hypothetical protein
VDDLLADVERRPVQLERVLHGVDCALDSGAETPGCGEEDSLDHGARWYRRPRRHPVSNRAPDGAGSGMRKARRSGGRCDGPSQMFTASCSGQARTAVRIAQCLDATPARIACE